MYKRIFPSLAIETNDPDIIAAVINNFSTNQAFWYPHFQAVFQEFAALEDADIPKSDWNKEVITNLKITVELPVPIGHINVFERENIPSGS